MDDFADLQESALLSWRACGEPGRVVAAVSGGADSAALLLALNGIRARCGFLLSAVHVDHGLRPDSGEDAAFVLRLCQGLNVPCRVERVTVLSSGEDGARKARYEALLRACRLENADALALAHHRRDQAETVLLHLFRGSGGEGLSGMAECAAVQGVRLWRPFLDVAPEKIRRMLTQQGQAWREDATNAGDDYLRNYLRHRVLPAVRARIPGAEEALCRAAKVLSAEQSYFREEAARFLAENACCSGPCRWIGGPALDGLHPALRRHCLRLACPAPLDYAQTERLMAASPGETVNLPDGWRAKRTARYLHFLSPQPEESPLGNLRILPYTGDPGDGIRTQAVPRAVFRQCVLRRRKTGDRIRPLGGPGDKSLQDYWVDRRVEQPFRDQMPLLCMGSRVVWSVGVGAGEEARVTPGCDAVLLYYEGYLPSEGPDAAHKAD